MNTEGLAVLADGVPPVRYGTSLSEACAQGSFVRRLLELPQVAGALHSLVGPEPRVDHHFVHTREQLIPPYPGREYDVSFLKHETFFERIVDARAGPQGQPPALRLL
ncbi:hypothetical protein [Streptomyces sp. NPDC051364]|uniref:hypothetical protein n=1 Tax=Streptomyces sp. NPDC051364 TaxID=3155799 RepID=UPI00342AEE9C